MIHLPISQRKWRIYSAWEHGGGCGLSFSLSSGLQMEKQNQGGNRRQSRSRNCPAPGLCDVSKFRPASRGRPDRKKPPAALASISDRVNLSAAWGTFCKTYQPSKPPKMVVDSTEATSHNICLRRYPPPSSNAPRARPRGIYARRWRTRSRVSPARFLRVPPPAPARPRCNEWRVQSSWPWRIRPDDAWWPRQNDWRRRPGKHGR